MSRELKRVPMDFDWPLKKVWWGYELSMQAVRCEYREDHDSCDICYGDGIADVHPKVEVPWGKGYQMWETTSEGSPLSPVFETPEELATWLADSNASAFGSSGASYDSWLAMIVGDGYAPSAIFTPEIGLVSGVEGLTQ